ncbi:helicase [Microcystis phage Mel-JY01]
MEETFSQYGHSFQLKVMNCLINDRSYLQQVCDIISSKYFETAAGSWIVEKTLQYFLKYKSAPTYEYFSIEELDITDASLKKMVSDTMEKIKKINANDELQYVKDVSIEFCKNQKMKTAILESVDLLRDGKFEQIKRKVDDALKAGADKDIGHEYNTDIVTRYSEGARVCVPTGWDIIDDLTQGGLANGELGVVIAPAGGGKSWGLVSIAANAILAGKTVVYYTLELNAFYVGRRIDAYLTNIPFQDLNNEEALPRIEHQLKNLPGELIIKYYPTGTASVITLQSHIDKCISQSKKPDLIIIDYADLLRPQKNTEKRLELNDIYQDIRGLAGEYQIPVWTASQSSRSSTEDEVIEGNKVSESYNKVMIADFVMSLSRKTVDKQNGTGRWHIVKNRFGGDGLTFPGTINTTTGKIMMFDPDSNDGQRVSKLSKDESAQAGQILDKFNSFLAKKV